MCGDPGGANAVAPVVEALRQDQRLDVHAFAYAEARSLWAKRLLPFDALDEHLTPDDAFGLLQRHKARLVLVGTSVNRLELERKFVAAARRNSTASLAVLDFWSNYRQRFSDESGRLAYLPDRIAVMDQRAHNEMVMCGFDPDRLVITGQPALDNLALSRAQFTPVSHEQIRRSLGISPLERLVVLADLTRR